jgi:hypothetical protein
MIDLHTLELVLTVLPDSSLDPDPNPQPPNPEPPLIHKN